jgi:hypothetical protein
MKICPTNKDGVLFLKKCRVSVTEAKREIGVEGESEWESFWALWVNSLEHGFIVIVHQAHILT